MNRQRITTLSRANNVPQANNVPLLQFSDEEQLCIKRISAAIKEGATPPYEDTLAIHKRGLEILAAKRKSAVDSQGQPIPVVEWEPSPKLDDPSCFQDGPTPGETPWREGAAHPREVPLGWMKLVYWNHPRLETGWTFQFTAANDPPTKALNIVEEGIKLEGQLLRGGSWHPALPTDVPLCYGGTSVRISYPRHRLDPSSPVEREIITFPYPAGEERRILPG